MASIEGIIRLIVFLIFFLPMWFFVPHINVFSIPNTNINTFINFLITVIVFGMLSLIGEKIVLKIFDKKLDKE